MAKRGLMHRITLPTVAYVLTVVCLLFTLLQYSFTREAASASTGENQSIAPRVHLLTCVTDEDGTVIKNRHYAILRPDDLQPTDWALTATRFKDIGGSLVIRNICEDLKWDSKMFGITKLEAMWLYVRSLPPSANNDLLISTDGEDIIFNGDGVTANDIMTRFQHADRGFGVLFMSEPWCWIGRPCTREDMKSLYPESLIIKAAFKRAPCPRFLNTGAYGGTPVALKRLLPLWLERFRQLYTAGGFWDDQGAMAHLHRQLPHLAAIDHQNELFAAAATARLGVDNGHPPCVG